MSPLTGYRSESADCLVMWGELWLASGDVTRTGCRMALSMPGSEMAASSQVMREGCREGSSEVGWQGRSGRRARSPHRKRVLRRSVPVGLGR